MNGNGIDDDDMDGNPMIGDSSRSRRESLPLASARRIELRHWSPMTTTIAMATAIADGYRHRVLFNGAPRRAARLSAGRVLAVAAQLDLVPRLSTMIAAVLPVRSLRFDHALTRRVRTFGRSSHDDDLRLALYAPARAGARSSVPYGCGLSSTSRTRRARRSSEYGLGRNSTPWLRTPSCTITLAV